MSSSAAVADVRVYLGAAGGSPVATDTDLVTYLRPEEIARYSGGKRLDNAVFTYLLAVTGEHVQNMRTPTGWSRQVEVRKVDGATVTPIFWGDLTQQKMKVDRGEEVTVTAAVFPYHFGIPLRGPIIFDPLSGDNIRVGEDIPFNPVIDGIVCGNMSGRMAGEHHLWGDPESYRTDEAETYQADELTTWSLDEAIKALCWSCNGQEDYVKNPDPGDYSQFVDIVEPHNVLLPRGQYLPYYLDQLLHPFGFDWFLKLTFVGDETEKRIKLYRRGSGDSTTVKMQPWGESIDIDTAALSHTNCDGFELTTDVGNVANKIRAEGGRKQYEITFELYRGWPEADDALTEADLDKSDPESDYHTDDKKRVWRLWVANEAGDWNSTRTTTAPIPAAPRDWSAFGVQIPRRRVIEDCLTYAEDGKRLPPALEWSDGTHVDPEDEESELEWYPVPHSWQYVIYKTQMAIEFLGDQPPVELIAAGNDAKLRVTCTITGDERIVGEADSDGDSPNGRIVAMELDASDRFAFREVVTEGDYKSAINDGTKEADERDDQEQIDEFAEYVRENEESATMSGRLMLPGINTAYEIGQQLTAIAGREISLDRNSEAAATPKYLQITGMVWNPQAQTTELVTSTHEVDPFYRAGTRPEE